MYITKKNLLTETGISYGQLYRWKREGLIPEEWFIKKPSKTGQETLLPRKLILERIELIQKERKEHSLEEIARMLSGHPDEKEFNSAALLKMPEMHPDIVRSVKEGEYSRAEAVFLWILSDLYQNLKISRQEINELLASCADFFEQLPGTRNVFLVFYIGKHLYGMAAPEQQSFLVDKRIQTVKTYQIEEMSSELARKYLI